MTPHDQAEEPERATTSDELAPPIRGGTANRESARQRDATINAPYAAVFATAPPPTLIRQVIGVVEVLTSEGASTQEIVDAIRQESPEIDEVVPQGWTLHQWVVAIVAIYMAILTTYATFSSQAPPPSADEIAEIVEKILSQQRSEPPTSDEEEQEPGAGAGGQVEAQ